MKMSKGNGKHRDVRINQKVHQKMVQIETR